MRMPHQVKANTEVKILRGGPDWIKAEHYDVEAKGPDKPTLDQRASMYQNLIADRFALKVHHETRELAAANLTLARKFGADIHVNEKALSFNASASDVTVTTSRGSGNTLAMAEYAVAGILHFAKSLHRAVIDREAQLLLVGSWADHREYYARLRELQRALGLETAVTFTGGVSLAALVAYYREADAFVSLSEHEGFGVPLLEAMRFRLPVVAYDAAAIGETVGDAGVLLRERDLAETAEAAALVGENTELREALVAAGEKRVRDFDPDKVAERTRQVLGL